MLCVLLDNIPVDSLNDILKGGKILYDVAKCSHFATNSIISSLPLDLSCLRLVR